MFNRNLILPRSGSETFFLWGPRQAGKSTLLRRHYPRGRWIDLLKSDEFRRYATRPELLRMELETARPDPERQVVIDEVQKVPALLNEVHWLMENRSFHFALCGSSARKVRRGAANLLGGRALRYELRGLTAAEIGSGLDLDRLLNRGYLPRIHQAARHRQLLDAYISDYLREEVAAEGMVRRQSLYPPELRGLHELTRFRRPMSVIYVCQLEAERSPRYSSMAFLSRSSSGLW